MFKRNKEISVEWTRHLKDADSKQEFKDLLSHSRRVLEVLESILEQELESSTKTKVEDYDSPSWAYRRADKDGYNRAIKRFLNLINLGD